MRVIIYGAGAIGGVTGGKLALAGFDTLYLAVGVSGRTRECRNRARPDYLPAG
jgi:ketopantoate reductase